MKKNNEELAEVLLSFSGSFIDKCHEQKLGHWKPRDLLN